MVHSSVCRAPAAVAVIIFVGCCIVRVGGRWLVVAGAVVIAMVFTVAIAGVVFAIVLVEVVVLAGVGGHCRGSRRRRDRLHRRCCGCRLRNHLRGSPRLVVLTEVVVLAGVGGRMLRFGHVSLLFF